MKICNFLKQIFKKTIQQQASENFKDLQQTLMPIVIDKDTYPQYYHPVEEIGNKLTDKNVRNIALTGPTVLEKVRFCVPYKRIILIIGICKFR